MQDMVLYYKPSCAFCHRVFGAADALGIELETRNIVRSEQDRADRSPPPAAHGARPALHPRRGGLAPRVRRHHCPAATPRRRTRAPVARRAAHGQRRPAGGRVAVGDGRRGAGLSLRLARGGHHGGALPAPCPAAPAGGGPVSSPPHRANRSTATGGGAPFFCRLRLPSPAHPPSSSGSTPSRSHRSGLVSRGRPARLQPKRSSSGCSSTRACATYGPTRSPGTPGSPHRAPSPWATPPSPSRRLPPVPPASRAPGRSHAGGHRGGLAVYQLRGQPRRAILRRHQRGAEAMIRVGDTPTTTDHRSSRWAHPRWCHRGARDPDRRGRTLQTLWGQATIDIAGVVEAHLHNVHGRVPGTSGSTVWSRRTTTRHLSESAIDNALGVAMMVQLATWLRDHPLRHDVVSWPRPQSRPAAPRRGSRRTKTS